MGEVQNAFNNNRVHIAEVDQVIGCGHVSLFILLFYCGIHGKTLPTEMLRLMFDIMIVIIKLNHRQNICKLHRCCLL